MKSEICGYLTADEYAQRAGVHRETVKRWLRIGKLEGIKVRGATWLIPHPENTAESAPKPEQGPENKPCAGCQSTPKETEQVIMDDKQNVWHLSCAGELLAKFVHMREAHTKSH